MRVLLCSMLALATAMALQPAFAQSSDELAERIDAAMAAAEAQAVRLGDEALSCDQMQAEIVANEEDPEYQAQMAAMNEAAEDLRERARSSRAGTAVRVVGGIALGVASSYIPGLDYVQMLAQRLQGEERPPEEVTSMVQSMEAAMPYIMRGARLYELAQAQQCAFLQEAAEPAPQPEQASPQE